MPAEKQNNISETKRKDYGRSLNLPEIKGFPMKAGLIRTEPATQKKWEEMKLFSAIKKKSKGRKKFVLHDGPPYANGSIHIGHLLNKILKDMVIRSKTMEGYDACLTPGWDCHGLPIEHKVLKEAEDITDDASPILIRKKCRNYAQKFVRRQTKEMKRLGTVADYENPYLTMEPEYEAGTLEVFSELVAKNIVSRELKPVYWSVENKTALAEAELEYHEKTDPSIYVFFPLINVADLPASLNAPKSAEKIYLMIWTTTPWTLPANLAVAAASKAQYGLYEADAKLCVVAEKLAENIFAKKSAKSGSGATVKRIGSCAGSDLICAKIFYSHPFVPKLKGRVVSADYVATDEGTGLVHTAPGHGAEDYLTGLKEGLEIYCPVTEDGTFDSSVPSWLCGKKVLGDANKTVIEKLRELKLLFHAGEITHSYPHDWRGKTPVIFRATPQWFIKMDGKVGRGNGKTLRQIALEKIGREINFYPEWGRKRLAGMLESRPDWCVSRQRSWGLPIPVFHDTSEDNRILMTRKSVRAVAEKIRAKGSNFWFEAESPELLEGYDPNDDEDAPQWAKDGWENKFSLPGGLKKGADIFDVWFESGSSWHSVLAKKYGAQKQADLYLEGSDQHRGWFQSSLIPSLAATGKPPFKNILTHGFIVDAQGKKMSKSGGNALEVEQVLEKYGADVCRWWVSSLNYSNDVKADIKIIETAADQYRTMRNTIRFLLGNLGDFSPEKNSVCPASEDKISLGSIAQISLKLTINKTLKAYSDFEYSRASGEIINFCDLFLSKHYIPAVRDALYCEKKNSVKRRRIQTVIHQTADALIKLCAPILVHTAEEAYHCLPGNGKAASVHLTDFPQTAELSEEEKLLTEKWADILLIKDKCLLALERAKKENRPSNPLDAAIGFGDMTDRQAEVLHQFDRREVADLIGVSGFVNERTADMKNEIKTESGGIFVYDLRNSLPKCDRCWKRDGTASEKNDGAVLCDRCADAVGI